MKSEKNRVDKFVEWIKAHSILSIVIIIGMTIITIGQFTQAIQGIKEFLWGKTPDVVIIKPDDRNVIQQPILTALNTPTPTIEVIPPILPTASPLPTETIIIEPTIATPSPTEAIIIEPIATITPTQIPENEQALRNIIRGLIAYYPFNGNANDESQHGNHGTIYGATLTTDRYENANQAYFFDGIDDAIVINDQNFDLQYTISIVFWLSVVKFDGAIVNKQESGGYALYAIDNHIEAHIWENGDSHYQFLSTENYIDFNEWAHITMTYDKGTVSFYKNGLLEKRINTGKTGFIGLTQTDVAFTIGLLNDLCLNFARHPTGH